MWFNETLHFNLEEMRYGYFDLSQLVVHTEKVYILLFPPNTVVIHKTFEIYYTI